MVWVVMFRISTLDHPAFGFAEFYRGSEAECRRIHANFAGGECDLVRTRPWKIAIGPAEDWYDFLDDLERTGMSHAGQHDTRPNRP